MYPHDPALTFQSWQYQRHTVATVGLPAGHLEAYRQRVRRLIRENVSELSDAEETMKWCPKCGEAVKELCDHDCPGSLEYYSMMDECPGEPEAVPPAGHIGGLVHPEGWKRKIEAPPEMPEVEMEVETETGIRVVLPLT